MTLAGHPALTIRRHLLSSLEVCREVPQRVERV